jgi:hypothetical protein
MADRYDVMVATEKEVRGEKKTYWTKVGVMFPAKEGKDGFAIYLDALPLTGKLHALPPKPRDESP